MIPFLQRGLTARAVFVWPQSDEAMENPEIQN